MSDIKSNNPHLTGGELGVITPISRVKSPQLPIYFRPFIRVITPVIHL